MATNTLFLPVEQPHLSQPRYSLLSGANIINMDANESQRFGNGFYYWPEGDVVTGYWSMCCHPDDSAQSPKTANVPFTSATNPWIDAYGAVEFFPYAVYGSDRASAMAWQLRNGMERARRKLNASLPFMLEYELWTGHLNVVSCANPSLQNSASTIAGGATCASHAIALLEQAVATGDARGQQKGGMRYMIHMRPLLLDYIAYTYGNNIIRREGNMWLTPMDNVVVGGRGYPGTGPAKDTGGPTNGPGNYATGAAVGGTEWMYISPMVDVRLGEVFDIASNDAQIVSRDTNVRTYWAEQIVHAGFDPTMNVYAVQVTTPAC